MPFIMLPEVDYVLITSLFVCRNICGWVVCGIPPEVIVRNGTVWQPAVPFLWKCTFELGGMDMSQINVNNLTFSYEGSFDNVFEQVSFSVDTDWKLGFLGRNGKGKTTFLNLLLGNYAYSGSITASVVFDYFPYYISQGQMQCALAEFAEELKPQCESWRVIRELDRLCESAEILYRPFGTLSPGERTKALLAVLFSGENDFLLIDEPTNHLDEKAREDVKEYLSSKQGFILVSHDRDLLDSCIDHVLVLNRKSIEVQKGNFSSWWENRQRKEQFAAAENDRHRKEIAKLKKAAARSSMWADKNESTKIGYDPVKEHDRPTRAYIGAKTKKMQSKVRQMKERIGREIEEKQGLLADVEQPAELKMTPLPYHKERLVEVQEYSLGYEDAAPLFTDLSFTVSRGQRIALHGGNGCGKSTLINMILQKSGYADSRLPVAETGTCRASSGLVVSYVNQDTSALKGRISEFCAEHMLEESLFCAILRQLDMERVQFVKDMEDYSEGQKKKALLAASLLTPAHLYIWDEPLNYIDVFSRIQIERLLMECRPTMLFVEHDARFRQKIATEVVTLP